jgi:hypothetical protein
LVVLEAIFVIMMMPVFAFGPAFFELASFFMGFNLIDLLLGLLYCEDF